MTMKCKPMTVAGLIVALQEHPFDACVVVPGYEHGYDHVVGVLDITLAKGDPAKWWSGRLQDADATSPGSFSAVSLASDRRRDRE
jgi:hypothetical protein